jgi:outer membrane protein
MFKFYLATVLSLAIPFVAICQQSKWTLQSCIDYAKKNNPSIRKASLVANKASVQLRQSRISQYPSINFNTGIGIQAGLAIDPTTNILTKGQALFQDASLTAAVSIYNGGRARNTAAAASYLVKASLSEVEKVSNDITLNVLYHYLQALAAWEQVNMRKVHTTYTVQQLDAVRQSVKAGIIPELNAVQIQAQLSLDSSNLLSAGALYQQQLLLLKETMNLDAAQSMELVVPSFLNVKMYPIADLQPADVYGSAVLTQPVQKGDAMRIKAAEKNMQVAKGAKLPNIDFIANLSTGFYNTLQNRDYTITGYNELKGNEPVVTVGGTDYFVRYPIYSGNTSNKSFSEAWSGYGKQISNNFGQLFGLRINVPILGGGRLRASYETAAIEYKEVQLQKQEDDFALKTAIYTAYNNARSAMQQLNAVSKSVEAAQQAYDFSSQRYNVGLSNTLDLLMAQNTLLQVKSQMVSSQYEYLLRIKLLEFYKGFSLGL